MTYDISLRLFCGKMSLNNNGRIINWGEKIHNTIWYNKTCEDM